MRHVIGLSGGTIQRVVSCWINQGNGEMAGRWRCIPGAGVLG